MEIPEKNGKIYTIRSFQTNLIYVGSTFEKYLSNRLSGHRSMYKNYLVGKANYISSIKLLEFDDYYIELVSEHGNITKLELRRLEGEYTREHKDFVVNIRIECRTDIQYRTDNAEKLRERKKKYYIGNFDSIKQRKIDNAEHIRQSMAQYRIKNADAIKEYRKHYSIKNADRVKKYYFISNWIPGGYSFSFFLTMSACSQKINYF